MTGSPPRLGVDIGRVIIYGEAQSTGDDTSFFRGGVDNALRTPPVPGALDALPRLVRRFEGQVWLVSKCGPWVEDRTRRWLEHRDFFLRTLVPPEHLRFCRRREEKAEHCSELGITHFVDDRLDVHEALRGLVAHLYLFGDHPGPPPAWVTATPTWESVEAAVEATLPPA
jgi:hypothetical protein